MTTAIVVALGLILTAWSWFLYARSRPFVKQCDYCRRPMAGGWYRDQHNDGRYCTMSCAHTSGAELVEWEDDDEIPSR